jgi:hypothetical protein
MLYVKIYLRTQEYIMESAKYIQADVFMVTALVALGGSYAFRSLEAITQSADRNAFTIDSTNQTTTDIAGLESNENFTSFIGIFPALMQALRSQMNVSLDEAITPSIRAVGTNSSAISASMPAERESLVYRVFVVGIENNIHMVVLDPREGNVLFSQQMPTWIGSTMLGKSSSE